MKYINIIYMKSVFIYKYIDHQNLLSKNFFHTREIVYEILPLNRTQQSHILHSHTVA